MAECIDCAALPTFEEWAGPQAAQLPRTGWGVETRPAKPRPIHPESGPRSPRCATHRRAWLKAAKQRASDKRSRDRSGLDEATRQEVLAEQGGVCPCGRGPGKRHNLTAEHDHDLAREHDHPEDVACPDCFVGFVCHSCNRHIIGFLTNNHGRGNVANVLRALANFLDDPPAQRVRAARALSVWSA